MASKHQRNTSQWGVSMNNLNDPPGWNIRPDERGDGGSNKWNYALLVPLLSLAAFRWIWTRESQREIQQAKDQYNKDMKAVTSELEGKYRKTLTESRRTAAHLELELEKEHHRVQGYREAMASQSRQLLEERKRLQREREAVEAEKTRLLQTGAAGAVFQSMLEKENMWELRAKALLKEFEQGLVERQDAYCSVLLPRDRRLEIEKNLLVKAAKEPLAVELNMEGDLKDIFRNDRHCADLMNTDKRKNGSLMWVYLRYWQLQVTLQKHRRAKRSMGVTQPDQDPAGSRTRT
ncbi:coiled-coil domain-containing protein 127-like isoform X2 [Brienomyrus brachyistius]|uniref:coiled-coil domain-containing protein 127-like isoform X2 n=1 Tax=Brienomyrus brachyistius TaxID=42636 RepID=UPI0020B3D2AB|nr:coiled-coil domain-containing protein 127-like isoform X2 [Brienomyrus brachyistius]